MLMLEKGYKEMLMEWARWACSFTQVSIFIPTDKNCLGKISSVKSYVTSSIKQNDLLW